MKCFGVGLIQINSSALRLWYMAHILQCNEPPSRKEIHVRPSRRAILAQLPHPRRLYSAVHRFCRPLFGTYVLGFPGTGVRHSPRFRSAPTFHRCAPSAGPQFLQVDVGDFLRDAFAFYRG
jgi:hypothetical protein